MSITLWNQHAFYICSWNQKFTKRDSSWQNWCNWAKSVGCLACTCLFSSAHKFSIGLRSGLCDGHCKTLTLLSLGHFVASLAVCFGSLSIWRTHLHPSFNFLAYVLRCCFSIFTECSFLMMPSILWIAPITSKANNNPTTWCCHPRISQLGWCSQACKLPLFSSKLQMVIMAKQFDFSFVRPQDMSPKIKVFVPVCICKL